jgi:hypothetical protein
VSEGPHRPRRDSLVRELGWNRLLALAVYLLAAAAIWGKHGSRSAAVFLITQAVVLVFIWFSEAFGEWIGPPPLPGGHRARVIDRETPPWLVAAFGWLILIGVFFVTFFHG